MKINILGSTTRTSEYVNVTIYGTADFKLTVQMLVVRRIAKLPKLDIKAGAFGIEPRRLADCWPATERDIDIILGQDALPHLKIKNSPDIAIPGQPHLVAENNRLGIVISGQYRKPSAIDALCLRPQTEVTSNAKSNLSFCDGESHGAAAGAADISNAVLLSHVSPNSCESTDMCASADSSEIDQAHAPEPAPVAEQCDADRQSVDGVPRDLTKAKSVEDLLTEYFSLEGMGVSLDAGKAQKKNLTADQERAEQIFAQNLTQVNGKYQVSLLLNGKEAELKDNRANALSQFHALERKFRKNPAFKERYVSAMQELFANGDVEPVTEPHKNGYFLPHSAVIRDDKVSSKTRLVWNASSAQKGEKSLNDCLFTGAPSDADILKLLVKFRWCKVAVTGDVRRMYLSIQVRPEDRRFLRFFWRANETEPLREFQFVNLPFGLADAPYSATECLKAHVKKYLKLYPDAAQRFLDSRYIDDYLDSLPDVDDAIKTIKCIQDFMQDGNFKVAKWASNSAAVLEELPPESRLPVNSLAVGGSKNSEEENNNESAVACVNSHEERVLNSIAALGVLWHVKDDFLAIKPGNVLKNQTKKTSKRTIASAVASVYDPLQLSAPYLITCKRLLQVIWQRHADEVLQAKTNGASPEAIMRLRHRQWDQPLPPDVAGSFEVWVRQLPDILEMRVPRCIVAEDRSVVSRELHVFSDASPFAFAAAVYVKATYDSGEPTIRLLTAKSRVAPADLMNNMPRLELLGALIASRLAKHVLSSLRAADEPDSIPVRLWTDSSVVLSWLKGGTGRWKTWVSNRVRQVTAAFPASSFRHVPGTDNPADLATRGISAAACVSSSLWRHGPAWLMLPETEWPSRLFTLSDAEATALDREARPQHKQDPEPMLAFPGIVDANDAKTDILLKVITNASSLRRLINVVALFKFKERGKGRPIVTVNDRTEVLCDLVQAVQRSAFSDVYETLAQGKEYVKKWPHQDMAAVMDNAHILRAQGRYPVNATSPDAPMLLPHDHPLTTLIVQDLHRNSQHASPELILSLFRRKFWMAKARRTIKAILRRCSLCTRFRGRTIEQVMAPLPHWRVDEQPRPFSVTGVDFAGPLEAYEDGKVKKLWILIFTCLQIRAMHLEVVSSMDTESLLAAIRRFMARRGRVQAFYSDNGRSFRLAAKEIDALNKIVEHKEVPAPLRADGIQWIFIAPHAPWRGGLYERLLRSAKECLRAALFRQRLTLDQIQTYVVECEGILNGRPLAAVSDDPSDPLPVTPGMLLQGYDRGTEPHPEDVVALDNASVRTRWRKRLHFQTVMLRHFVRTYLQAIRPRPKWHQAKDALKVGSLVFVQEPMKRLMWPLAKVVELHPGRDGHVRTVTLRTQLGIKKRPVQRLVPLEISDFNDGAVDNVPRD